MPRQYKQIHFVLGKIDISSLLTMGDTLLKLKFETTLFMELIKYCHQVLPSSVSTKYCIISPVSLQVLPIPSKPGER